MIWGAHPYFWFNTHEYYMTNCNLRTLRVLTNKQHQSTQISMCVLTLDVSQPLSLEWWGYFHFFSGWWIYIHPYQILKSHQIFVHKKNPNNALATLQLMHWLKYMKHSRQKHGIDIYHNNINYASPRQYFSASKTPAIPRKFESFYHDPFLKLTVRPWK